MNGSHTLQSRPVNAPKTKRFGIFPVVVGFALNRKVNGRDGAFSVRELRLFPSAKTIAVCSCGKEAKTVEALLRDHPSTAELVKAQQAHVYALWSDDPTVAIDDKADDESAKAQKRAQPIGYLSDVTTA